MLLAIGLLLLSLTPSVAAMNTARTMRREAKSFRQSMSIEDGIVTDDDGIIGNSARGADHAPRAHHSAHRPHRARLPLRMRPMAMESDGGDPMHLFPDQLPDPVGRDITDQGGSVVGDIVGDAQNGNTNGNGDEQGNGQMSAPNAQNGDVSSNDDATIGDNGQAVPQDHTADDGNSSGVLAWVIAMIALLAVVLVVLALIPKKSRSH